MSPYLLFLHNNHLEVTHRRLFRFLFCLSLVLPLSHESAAAKPLTVVQISVVRDGPSELVPEMREVIRKEILDLTSGEFDVRFPDDLQLEGGWSVQGVKQAIDRVLAQSRVDLVIALGILASQEVSQRRQLPKPVIAPLIIDPHSQGLPFKKGTSGMKNLSYLVTGKGFERNLEVFKEVFPFTRLTLLADRVLLDASSSFKDRARKIAERFGVDLTLVSVENSAEAVVGSIPPDTEAVYLSPLPRLIAGEFDRLVLALNRRKLPSFSAIGQRDVQRGITVALSPELDLERFARTIAANVHRILSGTDAGRLEVAFIRGEQLIINMATVREIDKWPSFQVLSEAELLNEDAAGTSRRLRSSMPFVNPRKRTWIWLQRAAKSRQESARWARHDPVCSLRCSSARQAS